MSTDLTTRHEHLEWCKQRALEYVAVDELQQAVASMMSDLGKDASTAGHMGIELGMKMLMSGLLSSEREVRKWITGFN